MPHHPGLPGPAGDAHRYSYHVESPGTQDLLITVASPKASIVVRSTHGSSLITSGVLGDNKFMISRETLKSDPGPYTLTGARSLACMMLCAWSRAGCTQRWIGHMSVPSLQLNSISNTPLFPPLLPVHGVLPETQYTVSTSVHSLRRRLAAADRGALQSVLNGPDCCSAPGSCGRLRAALSSGSTQDVCDQPDNVCDDAGHLVKLDLSHQVGSEAPGIERG